MTGIRVPRQWAPPPAVSPYAIVSHGTDRRVLLSGQELTIGRGTDAAIRVAHRPTDEHVSRLTATLRTLDDCVLVQNCSRSKQLVLRPLVGTQRVLEPGAATTSMPFPEFLVVVTGRFGREYAVHVDVRDLTPDRPRLVLDPVETVDGMAIGLTVPQRRLLAALCEPLLTRTGSRAAPATYRQVGERVGRSPGYARTVLRRLREQLAAQGVAALVTFNLEKVYEDFRPALARWAINSGTITVADVQALDAPT
ncbi:hypothetical protein [Kineosporia sp. NBRC 101731]|uniref:hypothetical protein n=1 Tax=Kineosporia sp. NBRC 101731 TaxID=3032199 RepID=UPI0024A0D931|nr:hypothetical protein [Kineosporia sp. NBRC 101731]GLY33594.1 hypothetical protein Kisp02_69590 [Kineosporia sp. NBRC 101731]